MIKKMVITAVCLAVILAGINWYGFSTPTKDIDNVNIKSTAKPVVFLVVDSLMDKPLQKAIKEGRAPALAFLSKRGQYFPKVVSSYPTMSVTIDSTLLTGTYANQHQLPGLVWFDKNENRLVNYGSGKMEVVKLGIKQVLNDSIYNLNQNHLSKNTSTIYEELDKRQAQSASVNGLIYRGNQEHNLHIPKLASTFGLLPNSIQLTGPTLLSMGSMSQLSPNNKKHNNVWQGLGLNDAFTAEEINYLIQNKHLPAFTLGYFPDLDHRVHKNGRMDIKGIEKVDQQLQTILDAYPSWNQALEEINLIVYGDSGQARIGADRDKHLIDLKATYSEAYQVAKLGESIDRQDQVALAVNERMAYVYLLDDQITYSEMISYLKKETGIGFIAWKDNKGNHVASNESGQKFTFQPKGQYTDSYDQNWTIQGDNFILDLSVNNQNEITYGNYPDALARLNGALHSHEGRYLIVDAKPKYEFIGESSPTHLDGAGHGALHKKDSLSPLIIAGTESQPKYKRVVDFKEWILELSH